uniref:NADH-ubiquinone oxidoreductase chain 6 n=3 Tax=Bactrocera TaxID=27456 RepID=Q6XSL1_BACOL|nr:NADH dehydrogenase subunit 6 [Bactrocera oleae]YP_009650362.1 NADH dehydrogenase subunit 6 [Bactrocera biguttula]AAO34637.1 NADH dehydrogenase subunit 6 [Bactrocera oleae]AAO34650.1 NADH dehydrogenase subunit 6 [Bactrocera oleae]ACY09689.1 NADH dehydrogenase subunit 6 [Bactrocera oleae]ACY09702.1 NADH dehydrogenase subunit 6 [Bactrocera oleae]ACY09715.1 NADH dehydrogenase subunit 6 [Bactrocera oleae]
MMQFLLYSSTLISSFIFIQMNHPLAMGLMLLIQTLQICLLTGLMAKSFWFSYILFLIFLGGMLVLFIYVTSLASNEMFSLSMKLTTLCITIMTSLTFISLFIDKLSTLPFIQNLEMNTYFNPNLFTHENSLNLHKLYNFPTNLMTILLMNYLLITLIAVVKITKLFYGPLRPMN